MVVVRLSYAAVSCMRRSFASARRFWRSRRTRFLRSSGRFLTTFSRRLVAASNWAAGSLFILGPRCWRARYWPARNCGTRKSLSPHSGKSIRVPLLPFAIIIDGNLRRPAEIV